MAGRAEMEGALAGLVGVVEGTRPVCQAARLPVCMADAASSP